MELNGKDGMIIVDSNPGPGYLAYLCGIQTVSSTGIEYMLRDGECGFEPYFWLIDPPSLRL